MGGTSKVLLAAKQGAVMTWHGEYRFCEQRVWIMRDPSETKQCFQRRFIL